MIIPNKPKLSPEEEKTLRGLAAEFNVELQKIVGAHRDIYAMLGDERNQLLINRVRGLEFIDRIDLVDTAFKLMDKSSELANHDVAIGGHVLGKELFVIAGHCTIDPNNKGYLLETAHAVKEAGARCLRGGVWKPRTSPHSYQGNPDALELLLEAKAQTGLPVITEVMDSEQLKIVMDADVDAIQIGTRNALNYSLLKEIGRTSRKDVCILLKRGMHMGKIEEFILAAEYIAAQGTPNIVLCPRGTVPAMDGYRNHPDECIAPLLKERTWAPVVVDPSHSVGLARYVPAAALSAVAYGADGLIIETHVSPINGIGDDPKQAIKPAELKNIIQHGKYLFNNLRKTAKASNA